MQRVDQRSIELEHRLAAGDDHQPPLLALAPQVRDMRRQRRRIGELAAPGAVGADEIGIAELAHRLAPVLLASRPQIASGKAQEHRAPPGLHALALQRQERFLDRVGHQAAA